MYLGLFVHHRAEYSKVIVCQNKITEDLTEELCLWRGGRAKNQDP